MKRISLLIACVFLLGLIVSNAHANTTILSYGSLGYVGEYNKPEPNSPADNLGYLKILVSLEKGGDVLNDGRFYDRYSSSILKANLPSPLYSNYIKYDGNAIPATFSVTGISYLMAKYDGPNGGTLVWLVNPEMGTIDIPDKYFGENNKYGLSSVTIFHAVPIPSSVMLLGSSLAGLAGLRLRMGRRR